MPATRVRTSIDWDEVIEDRRRELAVRAAATGVAFKDAEATRLVGITVREDAERARQLAQRLMTPLPTREDFDRYLPTALGYAEALGPDGPFLLLRRGAEVWTVPDVPDGWQYREPWLGDPRTVRWIGGPPAYAAFRRVGAMA